MRSQSIVGAARNTVRRAGSAHLGSVSTSGVADVRPMRSLGEQVADPGRGAHAVRVAHVYYGIWAAELESNLKARTARPGELAGRARRDQRELGRARPLGDGTEHGHPFGTHGEAERDVLDDGARHEVASGRAHCGSHAEVTVRHVGIVSSSTGSAEQVGGCSRCGISRGEFVLAHDRRLPGRADGQTATCAVVEGPSKRAEFCTTPVQISAAFGRGGMAFLEVARRCL